jgi:NAD(P)-dependent dehydrogenase (short-subunit alcohol dehydrogenase family)
MEDNGGSLLLLKDRVALITGGGRGIGRAIARKFASEGAIIMVTARTEKEVLQVAAEIRDSGGSAGAVTADVSTEEGCEKIVRETRAAFGAIHILVNNAGILGPVLPIEEIPPSEWDATIATNLRGPFLLSRLVLPEMYQRGSGSILHMISVGAKAAFPLTGPYAASKAALMGLTRTMAAESARKGVRVNAIGPGPVPETNMLQELVEKRSAYFHVDKEAQFAKSLAGILQGRPQTAEEVACAALFLVSDQASAITGQTLNVDGGMVFY